MSQANPFDQLALNWDDDPRRIKRAKQAAAAITKQLPAGGTWLDYGAGTGLLGLVLLDHADRLVLADSSAGMCAKARENVASAGLAERVEVCEFDLEKADSPITELNAVVSMLAFHHIADVPTVIARIYAMLAPGGWVAIVDLDEDGGHFHAHHGVRPAHNGFNHDQFASWLTDAGFTQVNVGDGYQMHHKDGSGFSTFCATARRTQ